jgi:hypothetical protein
MLLNKAVIARRPPIPAGAEFSLDSVDDPYGFASASELSLFRRLRRRRRTCVSSPPHGRRGAKRTPFAADGGHQHGRPARAGPGDQRDVWPRAASR